MISTIRYASIILLGFIFFLACRKQKKLEPKKIDKLSVNVRYNQKITWPSGDKRNIFAIEENSCNDFNSNLLSIKIGTDELAFSALIPDKNQEDKWTFFVVQENGEKNVQQQDNETY